MVDKLLEQAFTQGPGYMLAAAMFLLYRRDMKEQSKQRGMLADSFRQIVQENTRIITSLVHYIRSYEEQDENR